MSAQNIPIYGSRTQDFFIEHFMPSLAVGDPSVWVQRGIFLGEAADKRLIDRELDLSYGASRLQTYDLFRAADANAPVVIYFHGGYWRSYDKANYRYIPGMLVPQGVTTILANYDLCPSVTIDQIVLQTIACIAHIYKKGDALRINRDRLFIMGSSAGGHLVAMALAHDFAQMSLPQNIVKGAMSITGVHRLEPVLQLPVNDNIRLDAGSAYRNTTLDKVPVTRNPIIVAVGGDEPAEWIRMSVDYDTMLRENGIPGELLILPQTHRYSVTQTLADPASPLARALLNLVLWR